MSVKARISRFNSSSDSAEGRSVVKPAGREAGNRRSSTKLPGLASDDGKLVCDWTHTLSSARASIELVSSEQLVWEWLQS